jgi:hypothetical protein
MSFTRANPSGWSNGQVLTATQANDIDTNVSHALDKRTTGGQIDTRTGVVRYAFGAAASSGVALGSSGFVTSAATVQTIWYPILGPHGATVTAVTVYYDGAPAHAALPVEMPVISVQTEVVSSGSVVQIGAQVDTSANTTAFQARHAVTLSGLSHVLNRATTLSYVRLTTEWDTNALSGAIISPVALVTYTVSEVDFV